MTNVHQLRLPGMSWMGELAKAKSGAAKPTIANAAMIVGNDPFLSGLIAYDESIYDVSILKPPPVAFFGAKPAFGPYPRALCDNDISLVQSYVQRTYETSINDKVIGQAINLIAQQNSFHPIRDYLAALVWDRKPRIHQWLSVAFGVPDDAYHRAIGIKFLVAGCARIFDPGCKFDAMLVLEGAQEIGKSKSCRELFSPPLFSDEMPNLAGKEAPISMLGKWGVEISELNVLIRADVEVVKSFLSRQVDRYRDLYGRRANDRPRQTVFIGTTNVFDWAADSTGNRRFWPVSCVKAEHAWIAEVRDQLWAEALAVYRVGETALWLDDAEVRAEAASIQASRVFEDLWQDRVTRWLAGRSQATLSDALEDAVRMPAERQDKRASNRMAACFRAAGFESRVLKEYGHTVRRWVRR